MEPAEREDLEAKIRTLFDAGEMNEAATALLRGYGREIYSVLVAFVRDRVQADEAFSLFSENLWRALPSFQWECSARTWAYTIARNAARRLQRDSQRRARRAKPASDSVLEQVVQDVRTETLSFLRTEKKTRLQLLRESLPADDQLLIMLRLDRGLSWNELARVLAEDEALDEPALLREAARLRKRFQIVKEKLVDKARREGLVGPKED